MNATTEEALVDVERQPSAEQRPKQKPMLNQVKPVEEPRACRDDSEERMREEALRIISLTKQIQRTFQMCSLTQPVCAE
jgi:DNA relaxase NicK